MYLMTTIVESLGNKYYLKVYLTIPPFGYIHRVTLLYNSVKNLFAFSSSKLLKGDEMEGEILFVCSQPEKVVQVQQIYSIVATIISTRLLR